MKLNIKAHSETGNIKSTSGNEYIAIMLNNGNNRIGEVIFNAGSIVVQLSGDTGERYWKKEYKTKGKKKKDEECKECMSTPCQQL